jgi:hypothetical protein
MKKYLFGTFALALAVGFSAFTTFATELSVQPASITTANVGSASSYSETLIDCPGLVENPCKLDLTQVVPGFGTVTDPASLVSYLNARFPSNAAAQVAEINRIAVEWKD